METFFDRLSENLKLIIILKLNYKDYLHVIQNFIKIKRFDYEYLVLSKNKDIWGKIKDILKYNTELNFGEYTTNEIYVWGVLFVDLMKGFEFNTPSVLSNKDLFPIRGDVGKYNPISVNILSMHIIKLFYPNIYRNVKRYTDYLYSPYLFLENVALAATWRYNESREYPQVVRYFISNGVLPSNIEFNAETLRDNFTYSTLDDIVLAHIIIFSSPKSKIKVTKEFVDAVVKYRDEIEGDEDEPYVMEEYQTYKDFYDQIVNDIREYK